MPVGIDERDLAAECRQEASAQRVVERFSLRDRVLQEFHHEVVGSLAGEPHAAHDQCGAGNELGCVAVPADFGGHHQRVASRVRLAGMVVRVAEGEQQLGAAALVGGFVELEGLEGEIVRPRRFLVGGRRRRPIAGTRRVVDRLVDVAARRGLERVDTRAR